MSPWLLLCVLSALKPTGGIAQEIGRMTWCDLLEYEIRLAPKGDRLLFVGRRQVIAHDLPSGRKLWSIKASNGEISADGKLVATQTGRKLRLLDIKTGKTVRTFDNPGSARPFATFSQNGKLLVCRYGATQFACRSLPGGKVRWHSSVPGLGKDVPFNSRRAPGVRYTPEAMALNNGGAVVWLNEDREGGLTNSTWYMSSFNGSGKVIARHDCDQFFEYLLRVNPSGEKALATVACNPGEHFTRMFSVPTLKEIRLPQYPSDGIQGGSWVVGNWLLAVESDGRLTAYSMKGKPKVVFSVRTRRGTESADSFPGSARCAVSADGKTWVTEVGGGFSIRRLVWP